MDILQTKIVQLRTALDKYPITQQAEVSSFERKDSITIVIILNDGEHLFESERDGECMLSEWRIPFFVKLLLSNQSNVI